MKLKNILILVQIQNEYDFTTEYKINSFRIIDFRVK